MNRWPWPQAGQAPTKPRRSASPREGGDQTDWAGLRSGTQRTGRESGKDEAFRDGTRRSTDAALQEWRFAHAKFKSLIDSQPSRDRGRGRSARPRRESKGAARRPEPRARGAQRSIARPGALRASRKRAGGGSIGRAQPQIVGADEEGSGNHVEQLHRQHDELLRRLLGDRRRWRGGGRRSRWRSRRWRSGRAVARHWIGCRGQGTDRAHRELRTFQHDVLPRGDWRTSSSHTNGYQRVNGAGSAAAGA